MTATGVWIPDRFENYPQRWYYNTYSFVLQLLLFILIVIAEIAYLILVLGNIYDAVSSAVLLLSHIVQAIKVFTIWCRNNEIKQLIKMINDPTFTKFKKDEQTRLSQKMLRTTTIIGNVIAVSVVITASFWIIMPMLKKNTSLPLYVAFPFDITKSPVYEAMYNYCSLSVFVVGVCDFAVNFLVSGLVTLAVIQLDVLCLQLVSIRKPDEANNIYKDVVACVKHHQWIIRYVEELTKIFGISIFCQFIASSVIVCMSVFKITISKEPMEVIAVAFYLICVFMELFMYCYPGDLLMNKSYEVSEAVYAGNWMYYETKTKKAFLLMMLRAQRKLIINAGGVFQVSLATAASVIQTSYSYYAMLKNKNS